MTLKEFKEFVAAIPEEFDDLDIGYVDFSYASKLRYIAGKGELKIIED